MLFMFGPFSGGPILDTLCSREGSDPNDAKLDEWKEEFYVLSVHRGRAVPNEYFTGSKTKKNLHLQRSRIGSCFSAALYFPLFLAVNVFLFLFVICSRGCFLVETLFLGCCFSLWYLPL